MIAFISYSIHDSEQFVLTLLADNLSERGFSLTSHFPIRASQSINDRIASMKIRGASLYIGVITASGLNQAMVIEEYSLAVSMKVPALLLVEETVKLPAKVGNYNVIFFNRKDPKKAIEKINANIENIGNTISQDKNNPTNAAAWLFGGAALIGLVNHLSLAGRQPA